MRYADRISQSRVDYPHRHCLVLFEGRVRQVSPSESFEHRYYNIHLAPWIRRPVVNHQETKLGPDRDVHLFLEIKISQFSKTSLRDKVAPKSCIQWNPMEFHWNSMIFHPPPASPCRLHRASENPMEFCRIPLILRPCRHSLHGDCGGTAVKSAEFCKIPWDFQMRDAICKG